MSATDGGSASFADYGTLLRRGWRYVVAGLVLGLAIGVPAMLLVTPSYTAAASVLVQPIDVSGEDIGSGSVNLSTEAQLVRSAAVAERARKSMHAHASAAALSDDVSVSVPSGSSVLTITFTGATPADAARGAHYFAQAYLANREATAQAAIDAQAKALEDQVGDLTEKLRDVSSRLAVLPSNSTDRQYAIAQQNVLTSQLSALNAPLSRLSNSDVDPGRILTDAVPPAVPDQPVPALYAVAGAVFGLLVGIVVAVVRDRSDHSVRTVRDARRLLDLPVLGELHLGSGAANWTRLLPAHGEAAQEVRRLQHAIAPRHGRSPEVILVTAAAAGPATAVVAANLTAALARSGSRVVHVCAALRSDTGAALLGVRHRTGLAEVLLDELDARASTLSSPVDERVRVVPPGERAAEASDRFRTDLLEQVVAKLRPGADHVVLETPSLVVNADAQAWAQFCDVAVVVLERLRARREDAVDTVRRLEQVGCTIAGAVVISPHPRSLDEQNEPGRRPSADQPEPAAAPAPAREEPAQQEPARAQEEPARQEPAQEEPNRENLPDAEPAAAGHAGDGDGEAAPAAEDPPTAPLPAPLVRPAERLR